MKYEVTYACGHSGEVDLFGSSKERERMIWVYENRRDCPACEEEKKERANAESAKASEELGLPALTGSEKQVAWAMTIRYDALKNWSAYIASMKEKSKKYLEKENDPEKIEEDRKISEKFFKIADILETMLFREKDSASWWIENRCSEADGTYYRFKNEYKEEIERRMQEEQDASSKLASDAKEEATIKPEGEVRGVVKLTVADDKIEARYVKDGAFRELVKEKKYKWNEDTRCWFRRITVMTGSAQDRAAELINALLRAGFAVTCYDEQARAMAVDASFTPECERWILYEDEDTLKAIFPRDEKINDHVRYIGGHWVRERGVYIIQISRVKDIEELIRIYGFSVGKKAQNAIDKANALLDSAKTAYPSEVKSVNRDGLKEILDSSRDVLPDLKDE